MSSPLVEASIDLPPLPESVLIANRGEIACRVIATAKRLGVRTVAVATEDDLGSLHTRQADELIVLKGKGYLDVAEIVKACQSTGAVAVHPGYGFLSESEPFAAALRDAGVTFLGPSAATIGLFGTKHTARDACRRLGVPVVPGTDVLPSLEAALEAGSSLGYPIMLKAVAGGGGIGMQMCLSPDQLRERFDSAVSSAAGAFGDGRVYMEKVVQKPRHVEVQIFGDGGGTCIHLGTRECSVQRRHQKVVEESPAPIDSAALFEGLTSAATTIGRSCNYSGAGTVEFLVDGNTLDFYFLEVNTRLQVEHGITEMCARVDLVEWMLRNGGPETTHPAMTRLLSNFRYEPVGHAFEARVYCEDPSADFMPRCGKLTEVQWPDPALARVDTWVQTGTVVTPRFDPLVAKVIVHGADRAAALENLQAALAATRLRGTTTNLSFLRFIATQPAFTDGDYDTSFLSNIPAFAPPGVSVLSGGVFTTVQDWPGRVAGPECVNAWSVGIPPSGPMDALSHRVANALVGNTPDAATLEVTNKGPDLQFNEARLVSLCGAEFPAATLNGSAFPNWQTVAVNPGDVLSVGTSVGGMRGYIAVSGGFDEPLYMGSRSTLTLGSIGGHQGRALASGDHLDLGAISDKTTLPPPGTRPPEELVRLVRPVGRGTCAAADSQAGADVATSGKASAAGAAGAASGPRAATNETSAPSSVRPSSSLWVIGVLPGPQESPDFLTPDDVEQFYTTEWKVHFNSNRLGIRFIGPKPEWARDSGGSAGSHPSNIVDCEYCPGAVTLSGDVPIAITVDGPSLGGFVSHAVAPRSEMWKFGQVLPGDHVRFAPMTTEQSLDAQDHLEELISSVGVPSAAAPARTRRWTAADVPAGVNVDAPLLYSLPPSGDGEDAVPDMKIRRQGDSYILVEYGDQELDFNYRFRAHALQEALKRASIDGLLEMSPGVISLQLNFDNTRVSLPELVGEVIKANASLGKLDDLVIPSRIIYLPIAINDKWCQAALDFYAKSVRQYAPYLPNNFDFTVRNNGLRGAEELRRIMLSASYMCLGLGDVYLGCPCATPVDPRHRLVNPKFNPARTVTPEGAVGLGGSFLCIYPTASPGGYQLCGRTLPVWNTNVRNAAFDTGKPWLFRHFDQIRFYEATEEELEDVYEKFRHGLFNVRIEHEEFSVRKYNEFISDPVVASETAMFRRQQEVASLMQQAAEAAYWNHAAAEAESKTKHEHSLGGEGASGGLLGAGGSAFDPVADPEGAVAAFTAAGRPGSVVRAEFTANVWKVHVKAGDRVSAGEAVVVLEAMKLEHTLKSPINGIVQSVTTAEGKMCLQGDPVVIIAEFESEAESESELDTCGAESESKL